MFGKSKIENKSNWTVNQSTLYNNKTASSYRLSDIHTCFNEAKQKITIWHFAKFLATIPCTTKLYNKTFVFYHKCDYFIETDYEFESIDSEGRQWMLEGEYLVSSDSERISLAGLRFVKGANGVSTYLYGNLVLVFPNADVETLENVKTSFLDKRYQKFTEKELSALPNHTVDQESLENERQARSAKASRVMITTETSINVEIEKRLDIVTAEIAFGMNVFKDIFAAFSDFFGGRNQSIQNTLREAKETVLLELKREAVRVGGDAVIAVDLDYSEISGGGKSMLFLVASGTAVKLKNQ